MPKKTELQHQSTMTIEGNYAEIFSFDQKKNLHRPSENHTVSYINVNKRIQSEKTKKN